MAIKDADGTVREIGLEEALALIADVPHEFYMYPDLYLEAQTIIRMNTRYTKDAWKRLNKP